jgi:diacylglycerol O-acyltransferase / wax synthase
MQRLGGIDPLFLSLETPRWPTHVGGLMVLDPGDAPDLSFERLRQDFGERILHVPKFRWKLKEVPFGLGRPAWVEDPGFDIARHFDRVEVKAPGGRQEVGELVGELMAEPLDRRRPLWKVWYIDGLAGGKVGLFAMQHHCLMDGAAGASLSEVMMGDEPDPEALPAEISPRESLREPSDLELLIRSGVDVATTPVRVGRYVAAAARRFGRFGPQLLRNGALSMAGGAPATAFNRPVGSRRQLVFISVSLADVKAVRKSLDVTVNDVVVGLCGEALRRYLAHVGQPVRKALTAVVPVSMRAAGDRELNNRVSTIMATLATDVVDPAERIRKISRSIEPGKRNARIFQSEPIPPASELLPLYAMKPVVQLLQSPLGARLTPVGANTIVSDVMGPPGPLYVAGAKVTGIYSASVLTMKNSINFTVFSSDGRIDFGIIVDPQVVPDPWIIADAIPVGLEELMAASGLGQPERLIGPLAVPEGRADAGVGDVSRGRKPAAPVQRSRQPRPTKTKSA